MFSTEKEPSKLLVQNYRVPQALNQRTVFASFIQGDCTGLGEGDGKLGGLNGRKQEAPGEEKKAERQGFPGLVWIGSLSPTLSGQVTSPGTGTVCCFQLGLGSEVPLTRFLPLQRNPRTPQVRPCAQVRAAGGGPSASEGEAQRVSQLAVLASLLAVG